MFVAPVLVLVPGGLAFNLDIDLYGLNPCAHAFPRPQRISVQRQLPEVLLESPEISAETEKRPKHHVTADA